MIFMVWILCMFIQNETVETDLLEWNSQRVSSLICSWSNNVSSSTHSFPWGCFVGKLTIFHQSHKHSADLLEIGLWRRMEQSAGSNLHVALSEKRFIIFTLDFPMKMNIMGFFVLIIPLTVIFGIQTYSNYIFVHGYNSPFIRHSQVMPSTYGSNNGYANAWRMGAQD